MLNLNQYHTSGKAIFRRYEFQENDTTSLSSNTVFGIIEDAEKNIWVYTTYGISKYIPQSGTFKQYTTQLPIPNKRIMTGIVSKTGALWFSTEDHGLLYYNKTEDDFINYTKDDGLKHHSFLMASACVGPGNTLIFGSKTGVEIIDEIQLRQQKNYLYTTGLHYKNIY